jgi:hypothetical protein
MSLLAGVTLLLLGASGCARRRWGAMGD